jgi:hypothetical protein
MNQIVLPQKMLNTMQREGLAVKAIEKLLENMSAVEAYVMIAQMQDIVDLTKELLKERAIAGVQGKEMNVFGAKVSTRRSVAYEYDAPTLVRLDVQKKEIDAELKAVKKMLEAKGEYVDPQTGEMNKANKVKEGLTIAVSLPKGESK